MKVYNTLSRKKEEFVPIDQNNVRMYSCGPTVYNYAHIGNLRTYIFMDLLKKSLEYAGYPVTSVMNITDVGHLLSDADDGEDKMAIASKRTGKTPLEIAEYYSSVFFADIAKLNIATPDITCKATEHIQLMIDYVVQLVELGFGYETSDGIYFDISKMPDYGKLNRQNKEEQLAGARVEVNSEKRHPHDFALWKKAEPNHIMQWESPWGMGYPGWHIECSAMSRKYLGPLFDIHTGGVDHIPVHHENEIAQNEALCGGQKSVNYWMHAEFMLVDGGKMSKSLGNTYTIAQLEEKGYSALDFRYFCLNAHYRKKLNFTFEGMDGAKAAYSKLLGILAEHKKSDKKTDVAVLDKYLDEFKYAVTDDVNIPLALGVLWKMIKEEKSKDIYETALKMDIVLGLSLDKLPKEKTIEVPENILALCNERFAAKKNKDYAAADALRAKITELGYSVTDTKDGFSVVPLE